jgi:cytidine deaminase
MNKIKKYFKIAKQLAEMPERGDITRQYRVAAVCIRRDGTLVAASNLPTQSPNPNAHAESRVLNKATSNSTIYVVRVNRAGQYVLAKPCGDCEKKMRRYSVKRCYYTISNNEWGTIIF